MKKYYSTRSVNGLRLRNSPYDGETLDILPNGSMLEAVDEQTWVKVITKSGRIGFVLKDFLESTKLRESSDGIIQFQSETGCITSDRPICIHRDFIKHLRSMEQEAENLELKILVTSSLRTPLAPVSNAVVRPHKMSNHHIGHAIDVNFIVDGVCYGSKAFSNDKEAIPRCVYEFIYKMCEQGLRWGGYFDTPDYVHFDDMLNVNNPEEYQRKLDKITR